jgi:hypothetical protein
MVVRSTGRWSGRSRVSELKSSGKSFDISKAEVWEAWEKVKANKGAPGVDGCSIEDFEKDLSGLARKFVRGQVQAVGSLR